MQIKACLRLLLVIGVCAAFSGCGGSNPLIKLPVSQPPEAQPSSDRLMAVRFIDPLRAVVAPPPITARGAKNETLQYALQITGFPSERRKPLTLALAPLTTANGTIPITNCQAYQVLPMPVDTNHAAFLRYTGLSAGAQRLPRALLPIPIAPDGTINLSNLRDPDHPADPNAHPQGENATAILWIDVLVPPTLPAGLYEARYQLLDDTKPAAVAQVRVSVDDFVIPDERHLLMVGSIDWPDLERLWPDRFKGIPPRLLTRTDQRYAQAIRTLDSLVKLAEAHRCQAVAPDLAPTVFWPAGQPPRVDWSDFDSIVAPWMNGSGFPDQLPLGYWPMPHPDLSLHPAGDKLAYWAQASAHFDQNDWINRSSIELHSQEQGRPSLAQSVMLSMDAAQILASHPRARVTIPLFEEQVQLATPREIRRIQPLTLDRLLYSADGIVSATPIQRLPQNAGTRWLRTDLPGLIPYVGVGADERESRLWAWLAVVRDARLIRWRSVLPQEPDAASPAAPDELIWFYPGEWFGLDSPIPTVQLKWLRRAEQDFEYLWIARQRGQLQHAQELARLITKVVDLQGAQLPDPRYGLLSGSSNPAAWDQALELLSRAIQLAQPGQPIDRQKERELNFSINAWARTQERPLLMARTADFDIGPPSPQGAPQVDLTLTVDVYNCIAQMPDNNRMEWNGIPAGWEIASAPTVPHMASFSVTRVPMRARIDLSQLKFGPQKPLSVTFIDGYTQQPASIEMMLPVVYSEQRAINRPPLKIDGDLSGDWFQEDGFHDGPLTAMLSRPAVQMQKLEKLPSSAALYSSWTATTFQLAFKVTGADAPTTNRGRSWIDYDLGRAWGEDVCEVLIQPIYADNSTGPFFHAAFKPAGVIECERRLSSRGLNPWEPFNGGGILYQGDRDPDNTTWRGEMSIPWQALNAPNDTRRPAFLRFNFLQHRGKTGQSASWAGPLDFSRDDQLMGLIQVR